jgi:mRNA-degrading endonuclease RelE of RelBE toxin-antitoxin system
MSSSVVVKQMPAFKRVYKKLPRQSKLIVDAAIRAIIKQPAIGQEKKADLAGIFVYKFKIHHQEMLLAYEWDIEQRLLLALGVHENFYKKLKRQQNN